MMYTLILSCTLLLVLLVSPARAAPCGDTSGPGETRVACQCGDTVTTSTKLQPTDPVVSTACHNGLEIRSGDITLNCAGQTLTAADTGGAGIEYFDTTGKTIQNCTIQNCVATGFVYGILVGQCDNFRISANTAIGNLIGIDYFGGALNEGWGQVWKNRAVDNSFKGIYVQGDNNLIAKNRVVGSEFGLFVTGDFNMITGNKASGSGYAGIELFGYRDNQLTNNSSAHNLGHGIVVTDSTGAVVAHNRVEGNGATGLSVFFSGDTEISENTGKKNGWDGLYVYSTYGGLVTVLRGNEFNRNGRHGICTTLGHQDGGGNTGHNNAQQPDVAIGGC